LYKILSVISAVFAVHLFARKWQKELRLRENFKEVRLKPIQKLTKKTKIGGVYV